MLKAIIFDLDDTLIDWGDFFDEWEDIENPHLEKTHIYLENLLDTPPSLADLKKEYSKRTRNAWSHAHNTLIAPNLGRTLTETLIALGVDEALLELDALLKAYDWGKIPHTTVFPDVIPGLTHLRDAGLRFGLVTNAFQPMALRDVEMAEHGLLEFFPSCRFSAADHGYLKPHPSIFTKALDCLGLEPEEVVFIGDNPIADIAGAQAAGMRAVLRVTVSRKPLLSDTVIPDAAIKSLQELPDILDQWYPGWTNGAGT